MPDQKDIGQLSVDIFQRDNEIVIIAPVAGATTKDVNIAVTDEVLVISGERRQEHIVDEKSYLTKECYFGPFERSIVLPKNADSKKIQASFKNNILEIRIPKTHEEKTKVVKINVDT